MATLATYIADVQAALNDPLAQFYTSANLTTWVNRARSTIAKATGCVRQLTPSSGSLSGLVPGSQGSGYTTATVTISGPDALGPGFVTATATATVGGGQVTGYTITNAGSGYVLTPTVTISGNGTGATAVPTISSHMTTVANQEVYTFAALTAVLQANTAGVGSVIGLQDLAISWGGSRPVLNWLPWGTFQAYLRGWNQGASQPSVWSQFGRDENGSIYIFPVASQALEIQADCYCTPAALSNTQTVDLMPDNLYQAVIYKACQLAYISAQRRDDANSMKEMWREEIAEAASYAFPGRTPSYYEAD